MMLETPEPDTIEKCLPLSRLYNGPIINMTMEPLPTTWLARAMQLLGSGPSLASQRLKLHWRLLFLGVGAANGALLQVLCVLFFKAVRDALFILHSDFSFHWILSQSIGLLGIFLSFIFLLCRNIIPHQRKLWLWLLCGQLGALPSILLALSQICLDCANIPRELRHGFLVTIPLGLAMATAIFYTIRAWPALVAAAVLNGLAYLGIGPTAQAHLPGAHAITVLCVAATGGALLGMWVSQATLDWCLRQEHILVGQLDWLKRLLLPFKHLGVTVREVPSISDVKLCDLTAGSVVYVQPRGLDEADRAALRRHDCTVLTVPEDLLPGLRRHLLYLAQIRRHWGT